MLPAIQEHAHSVCAYYRDALLTYLAPYIVPDEWSPKRLIDGSIAISNGEERYNFGCSETRWQWIGEGEPESERVTYEEVIYRFITRHQYEEGPARASARAMHAAWMESAKLGIDLPSERIEDLELLFGAAA